MDTKIYDMPGVDISWCPGCGNYLILKAFKAAVAELDILPERLMMVSGVGSASKVPHYIKSHVFNGLHGRILPPACAIKAVNPELTVIAAGGDGDIYGEGGNHLLHAIRRNSDVTAIVHNNMLYCLTKKQASPSSLYGLVTPVQVHGVTEETFNPLSVAISLNATFVARAYCADVDQTKEIFKKAISHRGFALVDVLMPCITFEVSSFKSLKEATYYLEDTHDVHDRIEAFKRAVETDRIPLGVFYTRKGNNTFEDYQMVYKEDKTPLAYRTISRGKLLRELVNSKKD